MVVDLSRIIFQGSLLYVGVRVPGSEAAVMCSSEREPDPVVDNLPQVLLGSALCRPLGCVAKQADRIDVPRTHLARHKAGAFYHLLSNVMFEACTIQFFPFSLCTEPIGAEKFLEI